MPSNMTAEAFHKKYGKKITTWLRDNTSECACDSSLLFGADEKLAHPKEGSKVKRYDERGGVLTCTFAAWASRCSR